VEQTDQGSPMGHLDYVESFVRALHRDMTLGTPTKFTTPFVWRKGKGTLFLEESDVEAYSSVVARLTEQQRRRGHISKRTLESYVQDVLFTALDFHIDPKSDARFDERLAIAMVELHRRLQQPAADYVCYVPVSSLSPEGLPWTLGTVRLVQMNAARLRRNVAPLGGEPSRRQIATRRALIEDLTSDPSLPRPMVEVTVHAKDVDAAMDAAMSKTREIVNILNFFAPFVPNNPEWAYLAGEAERTVSTAFVVRDGRLVQASSSLKGPLGGLSCKRLKSTSHLRPALRRVHELLRDPDRSQVGERLVTSAVWAGRASVEPVRENAFLQYMIALETLMLPDDPRDIGSRLRTRVGRFLGHTVGDREWFHDNIIRLYKTRSDISHEGFLEVSGEDLDRLSAIVRACVFQALVRRGMRRLATSREFARWLDTH
jgi:Apea-like HEPN